MSDHESKTGKKRYVPKAAKGPLTGFLPCVDVSIVRFLGCKSDDKAMKGEAGKIEVKDKPRDVAYTSFPTRAPL